MLHEAGVEGLTVPLVTWTRGTPLVELPFVNFIPSGATVRGSLEGPGSMMARGVLMAGGTAVETGVVETAAEEGSRLGVGFIT